MNRFLSSIKLLFIPPSGRTPRKIKGGIFSGQMMELDLACQTQLYLGLFERELYKRLKKLSTRVNTAIDIGAGEGEYTLYFLMKTQVKKIFAFEPSRSNRARLMTNLELNGFTDNPRLELSSKYVGSLDGQNECALDSLLSLILLPCLIKMDVDGGEVASLQGATKLLNLPEIYWIIETHSRQLEEQCVKILNRAGFVTTIVSNAWWRYFIPELRPLPHNRWLIAIKNSGKRT